MGDGRRNAGIAFVLGAVAWLPAASAKWTWELRFLPAGALFAIGVALIVSGVCHSRRRRRAIEQLGLHARAGAARLRMMRTGFTGDTAQSAYERHASWERRVCDLIQQEFGQAELALFEGVKGPRPKDVSGVVAMWQQSLDRLADVIRSLKT